MDFSSLLAQLPLSSTGVLQADSRKVHAGDIFVACQGEYADGRVYIADAIARGAAAVVYDSDDFAWLSEAQVPMYPVAHLRKYAGILASQAYGNPSHQMPVIGVTGTNGKTSCTQWLAQAFDCLQQKTAVIGGVGNGFMGNLQAATHTTPEVLTLQALLHHFCQQGAQRIAMEVSSHGLEQHRVAGVRFDVAILTNLTRDHLDYHGSMQAYASAKAKLFQMPDLRVAILNLDDDFGVQLHEQIDSKVTVYTYGFHAQAQVQCTRLDLSASGMLLSLSTPWGDGVLQSSMLGRFNAYNMLAVLTALLASGIAFADALQALQAVKPALGRMQTVGEGQPLVVVDYAHTPDALQKALQTLKEMLPEQGRLWCVFGCGGDRDKGKRPLMGQIANELADELILTDDNPRTENPHDILAQIAQAAPSARQIPARDLAIKAAISQAAKQDIILIAGKGHETYQEIKGVKLPFDDVQHAIDALAHREQGVLHA